MCARNDSPIERRANTRQPASQPSCLEYLHSESYKRSKKASRFRVGVSPGKRLGNIPGYFVLLRLLEIGKFIPFTNSFPANVIFIGSHLSQTDRFPSFAERMRRGIPHNSNK